VELCIWEIYKYMYNSTRLSIRLRPRDYHISKKRISREYCPTYTCSLFSHSLKNIGHLPVVLKHLCRLVNLKMVIENCLEKANRSITQLDLLHTQELFKFEVNSNQTNRYRHVEVEMEQTL